MISLFLLVPAKKFRGLSPYFSLFSFLRKGIVFHYDFLVPSDSGQGSGACLPAFLFTMISWLLVLPL